jgi:hypothetical protein
MLWPAVADGGGAAVEEDVATSTESPITAQIDAAATIHPLLLFETNRHTLSRRDCLAVVSGADGSGDEAGESGGTGPPLPEPSTTGGANGALEGADVSSGFVGV